MGILDVQRANIAMLEAMTTNSNQAMTASVNLGVLQDSDYWSFRFTISELEKMRNATSSAQLEAIITTVLQKPRWHMTPIRSNVMGGTAAVPSRANQPPPVNASAGAKIIANKLSVIDGAQLLRHGGDRPAINFSLGGIDGTKAEAMYGYDPSCHASDIGATPWTYECEMPSHGGPGYLTYTEGSGERIVQPGQTTSLEFRVEAFISAAVKPGHKVNFRIAGNVPGVTLSTNQAVTDAFGHVKVDLVAGQPGRYTVVAEAENNPSQQAAVFDVWVE